MKGLTPSQVEESRRLHGANILTPPKKKSLWRKFLEKFTDPLIIILIVAAILSVGISCYEYWGLGHEATVFFEPLGIFIAILLATALGFIFEERADREFALLNQVNDDEPVRVLRSEGITEVPKRDIVVGDIVYLNTGDEVPADGTLLESTNLTLDESTLTGEPSCHKTTDPEHFDKEATYPSDTVLRGTKVMEGHGIYHVDKVGDATENGKVYTEAQIDDGVKTPLNEQLDRLGKFISRASYAIGFLVVVGRCIVYFAQAGDAFSWMDFLAYFLQTIMIAVTLVVVSVPEGLPMAVTLSLAMSMRRMLKTNNLVRKLHACETMGAATVICTDKTGTLTQNRMQVAEADFFAGVPQDIVDEGIAVNSTASLDLSATPVRALGNPTEGALLLWLRERGVDFEKIRSGVKRLEELPFSTERKYMATVVENPDGKRMLFVKGAPEIVLGLSATIADGVAREKIEKQLFGYQSRALRTLGFAWRELSPASPLPDLEHLSAKDGLEFIGMTAISDPVRSDVAQSVAECTDAGIAVKIVTGDTPATASEIGRQIGLLEPDASKGEVITGPDFAALTDDEVMRRAKDIRIIARARPGDKKRLVEALQKQGEVVAVTGDGTNDAPALKAAHVGLSMGDGTSVAKEASDITIIDNSFASIGRAVMWGRSLYKNIQRFILFQLTVNLAACLIVLFGAFMGTDSPLTVTQMLWVNLIMDTFAAMALASLPPSQSVMRDKPRRRTDFIINRAMRSDICWVGLIFFGAQMWLLWVFQNAEISSLSQLFHPSELDFSVGHHSLTPYELSLFFTIFVFLQFWNLFNARSFETRKSIFTLGESEGFIIIALAIFVGQVLIVEFGGEFFSVVPLKILDWVIIVGFTSLTLWIRELVHLFTLKRG